MSGTTVLDGHPHRVDGTRDSYSSVDGWPVGHAPHAADGWARRIRVPTPAASSLLHFASVLGTGRGSGTGHGFGPLLFVPRCCTRRGVRQRRCLSPRPSSAALRRGGGGCPVLNRNWQHPAAACRLLSSLSPCASPYTASAHTLAAAADPNDRFHARSRRYFPRRRPGHALPDAGRGRLA